MPRQLGHGADHEYNAKEGTVKLAYAPQPVPTAVMALKSAGARVTKVACGHNHVVAVDAAGKVYTWGNGGYGRLGHKEQKDEWLPKQAR
jgi:alpha-tubulin suppressor-like RCC1 family protein